MVGMATLLAGDIRVHFVAILPYLHLVAGVGYMWIPLFTITFGGSCGVPLQLVAGWWDIVIFGGSGKFTFGGKRGIHFDTL